MTKIKKQCAWPKGDFSFENTLSSRKHSGAKFPIFIKISSIRKQNPFNFNILAHLIFTPCCSNRVFAKGNIKSKVATHDPKHMFQNMEQESSTSCHFIASYSWVLLLTLLSYAGLEAEGCSGKTDLRDFLCTWPQWHSRYIRAFSDINKKGFVSALHVKVESQISACFILTWHWSVQAVSQSCRSSRIPAHAAVCTWAVLSVLPRAEV